MSSGEVHFKYFLKGYGLVLPESVVLSFWDFKFGLGTLVGYSLGRWIDPDLDLMGVNMAEGRQVNEIPFMGHIMFGVSSAYGSFFRKHHRSFLTHFPVISTLIRLIVFFITPFLILDGYVRVNLIGGGWHMFWLGLWSGLSQADAIHYYLDLFPRVS